MKLEPGTAAWLAVLAAGVALWVWLLNAPEQTPAMTHGEPTLEHSDRLLAWPLARIAVIDFAQDGRTVHIEQAGPVGTQAWHYGHDAPAGDDSERAPTARFLDAHLAMFAAARIERSFALDPDTLADYGLAAPAFTVRIQLDARAPPARELAVGARTPDGFGQYVHIEPDSRIVTVPAYHVTNLTELLAGPPAIR